MPVELTFFDKTCETAKTLRKIPFVPKLLDWIIVSHVVVKVLAAKKCPGYASGNERGHFELVGRLRIGHAAFLYRISVYT